MIFPTVEGENLERRKYTFPRDLERDYNLLLIAFERWQQNDIDTWMPVVKRLVAERSDLTYYELPTISKLNPLFQWYVNSGMRAGIPDRNARAATITLYIDKAAFKQALQLPDEQRIYLLLVKGTGEVLWRTEGPYTHEKEADLSAHLTQSLQG